MKKTGAWLVVIASVIAAIIGLVYLSGKPVAGYMATNGVAWGVLVLSLLALIWGLFMFKQNTKWAAYLAIVSGIIGWFFGGMWFIIMMIVVALGGLLGVIDKNA